MAYISQYSGEQLDESITINENQNNKINALESQNINLENSINDLNNNIITLQSIIDDMSKEVIPIERGGTGATTASEARANLNYHEGIVAYGTTAGSHTISSSFTSFNFSSIDIINSTYATNSSSSIKILQTGYYRITLTGRWGDVSSNNNCYLGYGINGDASDNGGSNGGAWWTNTQRLCHNISFIRKLTAGDYIKPVAYSNSSTTMNAIYMSVEKISL